jgi:hypothetical protein
LVDENTDVTIDHTALMATLLARLGGSSDAAVFDALAS